MNEAMPPAKPRKQKFLPLREITINSRPLIKRAIQFSCDGDLVVTADDSVHVFVPEFPDLSQRREKLKALIQAQQDGRPVESILAGEDDSSDEEDAEGMPKKYTYQPLRAQYSEGGKHIPVSFPPLDPRVNRELFAAQRLPFPYEGFVHADGSAASAAAAAFSPSPGSSASEYDDDSFGSDDDYSSDRSSASDATVPGLGPHRPRGAGYGPITGTGSSMNHVVAVGWSPSGLGVNRRPVLGVLTGAGTLAVFGDGGGSTRILPRANQGMLQRRELNAWIVLWGVGERLVLPGQQTEVSEYLRAFAWAAEVGPGQALLATANDVKEVAVVSVQCVHDALASRPPGAASSEEAEEGMGEEAVWLVREVARFKAEGPHKPSNPLDPDWVPHGTSFGLRWSPWLETADSRTCVLSYIDRNYVGFRRITIRNPWVKGEAPNLEVEDRDMYGICLHLSTDAFVEFEDAIWTHGDTMSCRGLISTGFSLRPFEVALRGGPMAAPGPHKVWDCRTAYRDDGSDASQNPICDLIIHPPDLSNPTPVPLYTLVRMTATSTTQDWYETNVPAPDDLDADPRPQWVRTIAQKLDVRIPADMHLTRNYDDDSFSEGSGSDSDDEDDEEGGHDGDVDDDDDDDEEEEEDGDDDEDLDMEDDAEGHQGTRIYSKGGEATVHEMPEIHPHRFRIHGLTLSPGGGVVAALVSSHSTQHPERGGWHTVKSSVLFGHRSRRLRRLREVAAQLEQWKAAYGGGGGGSTIPIHPDLLEQMLADNAHDASGAGMIRSPQYARLTTEAKLFENLYGDGPEVPGLHYFAAPPPSSPPSFTTTTTTAAAAAAAAAAPINIVNTNTTHHPDSNTGPSTHAGRSLALRHLFAPALAAQTCDLCSLPLDQRHGALSGCRNGHFFGTCATSGLAVQTPGATRRCGACGRRTLRADALLARIPPASDGGGGGGGGGDAVKREDVVRLLGSGVCGSCGGKFLT
ncbi:hypothetical protein VTJ83DRAFT_4406 [Remersonia thermophila]|uniref:Transcription factor IIIC putative zinc-finger domain-containing protein n=1 Tax=Remersonia thermophila TaxID=72144 RepID=A0ABR4D9T6_9PEZI